MTLRDYSIMVSLVSAGLACASPTTTRPIGLPAAYQLYANGDCTGLRARIEATDASTLSSDERAILDLLQGYCAELGAENLSARDRYAAVMAEVPNSGLAFEAAFRLRELDRLQKQGVTRDDIRERVERERTTPLYLQVAQAKYRDTPIYPRPMADAGIEGWVWLDFEISPTGSVSHPIVVASYPPFVFETAALAAVRNWAYPPAESASPRRATVNINFQLQRPKPDVVRTAARPDASPPLQPVEKRGREIYENELASDRAGDALVRAGVLTSLWNWIVVPDPNGLLVRYVDEDGQAFADVLVDVFSTDPEQVTVHDEPVVLPPLQLQMWNARVAALALVRANPVQGCSVHFSWVILPSLDPHRSWDVYLLSVTSDPHVTPIGGHYRVAVSNDPHDPPELHALAESCEHPLPVGSERLMLTERHSKTPTELHVFLNLRLDRPLGVAVDDQANGLWFVEHGRIRRADESAAGP